MNTPPIQPSTIPDPAALDALPRAFVVGCQKSGTTWMQVLLRQHPEVCSLGEACFGSMLVGPMAQMLSNYNANQRGGKNNVFSEAEAVGLMRLSVCLLQRRWVANHQEPNRVRLIAEKTPEHALALKALGALFPDMRVIHIIRDGRDGVASGWHHNLRDNEASFRARFATKASYARYFVEHHWLPYIHHARAWGRAFPDRYLELQYEHALEDPTKHTRAIFAFLGVDDSDAMVDRAVERASFKAMSGGRDPGQTDNRSHVRKGQAGAWREELDADSVRAFEELGSGLLGELGYELSAAKVA